MRQKTTYFIAFLKHFLRRNRVEKGDEKTLVSASKKGLKSAKNCNFSAPFLFCFEVQKSPKFRHISEIRSERLKCVLKKCFFDALKKSRWKKNNLNKKYIFKHKKKSLKNEADEECYRMLSCRILKDLGTETKIID